MGASFRCAGPWQGHAYVGNTSSWLFMSNSETSPTLALQPSVCDSEHHSQMRQTVKHEALLEYSRAAVKSTENLIHFVEQQMLLRFITNEWEGHKWGGGVSQEVSCIDLCFHCGRLPEFILCLYSGVNFSFAHPEPYSFSVNVRGTLKLNLPLALTFGKRST